MKNFSIFKKAFIITSILVSMPAYAAVTSSPSATSGAVGVNGGAGASANTGATVNGAPMNSTTTNVNTGATTNSSMNNPNSWNTENAYWKNNYPSRPYYNSSRDYSYYEPAYRYGVDMYNRNQGKSFDELSQSDLSSGWANARGKSSADWSDVQMATRDAYNRMYESQRGTAASGSTSTTTTPVNR